MWSDVQLDQFGYLERTWRSRQGEGYRHVHHSALIRSEEPVVGFKDYRPNSIRILV